MANQYDYPSGQTRDIDEKTRIFLQPIAAPSILGLYAFATAAFLVSINLAGWYGPGLYAEQYVLPFAAVFGGLAELLSAMWSFRARDGLATAVHGMWGSFWLGYGLLFALIARGAIAITPGVFVPLGYWFVPLSLITFACAVGAMRQNVAMASFLFLLGVSSAIAAVGFFSGIPAVLSAAGWVMLFSSIVAYYTATGMMFEPLFGTSILPLGHRHHPVMDEAGGEPAVIKGQ